MAKNAPKIAEAKLSSCGLKVANLKKIAIAELRSTISLNVAELRLRKCFLLVAELRLRIQKKVARAHLWLGVVLAVMCICVIYEFLSLEL
jgi:hypothetical protein